MSSAFLSEILKQQKYSTTYSQMENDLYPARQSFDNLVLTIDILFAVGAVTLDQNGRLERCRLALPILLEARQVTLDQNRWLERCASSS